MRRKHTPGERATVFGDPIRYADAVQKILTEEAIERLEKHDHSSGLDEGLLDQDIRNAHRHDG